MTVAGPLSVRHSPDFVAAWRSVFCIVYRWRQDGGRFAMVPSLLGSPVFAYLPGALLRVELVGPGADAGQSDAMTSQHEMAW